MVTLVDYCPESAVSVGRDLVDVTSPFYPLYYPNNVDCIWHVTNKQPSGYLVITFMDVNLHPGDDFLTIGIGNEIIDSSVILRLTGNEAPRIVTVGNSSLWMRFTTDAGGQFAYGFWLQLERHDEFGKTGNWKKHGKKKENILVACFIP